MSISSESSNEFSTQKMLDNLFLKFTADYGSANLAPFNMLKCVYKLKPEAFILQGGIHNSEDGTKTYYTLHFYYQNGKYYPIHINGIMRGKFFIFNSVDIFENATTQYSVKFSVKDKPWQKKPTESIW